MGCSPIPGYGLHPLTTHLTQGVKEMAMTDHSSANAPRMTIGVRAWNEEAIIRKSLESIFQQSLFEELARRKECCEVLCIPNGCHDRTAEIAAQVFAEQERSHPFASAF